MIDGVNDLGDAKGYFERKPLKFLPHMFAAALGGTGAYIGYKLDGLKGSLAGAGIGIGAGTGLGIGYNKLRKPNSSLYKLWLAKQKKKSKEDS